ncbi:MAG: T9SS type A sorting domain-containing protein [Bacteroidetes bacterium]|nr:T9SS type A sorting domain-containing protein [Bacteroidota bacterium]
MLKKLSFITLFIIAVNTLIYAQPCTPDVTHTTPGTYPDTVTNLPIDTAGIQYNAVMTAVIPADTVISGLHIDIDSIGITGMSGLPSGFSYAASTSTGYWHGGSAGCILISGTATDAQADSTYKLRIYLRAWAGSLFLDDSLMHYRIRVVHSLGVSNIEKEKFTVSQNMPNPFSKKTEIVFTSPTTEIYQFSVINLLGQVISTQVINAKTGENKIEFNASVVPAGIYLYKLGNKSKTITKRMIVTEN